MNKFVLLHGGLVAIQAGLLSKVLDEVGPCGLVLIALNIAFFVRAFDDRHVTEGGE
jgi:hypothetical protein